MSKCKCRVGTDKLNSLSTSPSTRQQLQVPSWGSKKTETQERSIGSEECSSGNTTLHPRGQTATAGPTPQPQDNDHNYRKKDSKRGENPKYTQYHVRNVPAVIPTPYSRGQTATAGPTLHATIFSPLTAETICSNILPK